VQQTNRATGHRERNDRLAAVPVAAHRQEALASVFDVSERVRAELERFFRELVAFEDKDLAILGPRWTPKTGH
jgi:hypothetical protein